VRTSNCLGLLDSRKAEEFGFSSSQRMRMKVPCGAFSDLKGSAPDEGESTSPKSPPLSRHWASSSSGRQLGRTCGRSVTSPHLPHLEEGPDSSLPKSGSIKRDGPRARGGTHDKATGAANRPCRSCPSAVRRWLGVRRSSNVGPGWGRIMTVVSPGSQHQRFFDTLGEPVGYVNPSVMLLGRIRG
jgi:hypothetical protein